MELEIAGIPVRIIKKDIKNMHLYVKPPDGHVEVSAPLRLSDESIAMFVRTRVGWIKNQQEKFRVQPRPRAGWQCHARRAFPLRRQQEYTCIYDRP